MLSILFITLFFSLMIWCDMVIDVTIAAACLTIFLSYASYSGVGSTTLGTVTSPVLLIFLVISLGTYLFFVRPALAKAKADRLAKLKSLQDQEREKVLAADHQRKLAERSRVSTGAVARQRTSENIKTNRDLNSAPSHAESRATRDQQDKLNQHNRIVEYAHSEALLEQAKRDKEDWRKSIRLEMEERLTKWTKERVIESAKNFRTTRDWARGEGSAYNAAIKHGWVEESCKHMSSTDTTPS